jgi:hypothetical protein
MRPSSRHRVAQVVHQVGDAYAYVQLQRRVEALLHVVRPKLDHRLGLDDGLLGDGPGEI